MGVRLGCYSHLPPLPSDPLPLALKPGTVYIWSQRNARVARDKFRGIKGPAQFARAPFFRPSRGRSPS